MESQYSAKESVLAWFCQPHAVRVRIRRYGRVSVCYADEEIPAKEFDAILASTPLEADDRPYTYLG